MMPNQNKILVSLTRKLGKYQLRNNGEYGFECPKCSEHRGKFHMGVNVNKNLFNCFRCKYSGHVRILGVEVEKLRDKKEIVTERMQLPGLPDFIPYGSRKMPHDTARLITRFLQDRGISPSRAVEMGVGCSTASYLQDRLLLPIVEQGAVRYWVARLLVTGVPSRVTTGVLDGGPPKEMGPRNGLGWDRRSEVLYGLDEIPLDSHVVLVEGIFDAEHLKSFGYSALSTLGSNISEVQIGKILAKSPSKITVFFDGDDGGRKGAFRAKKMFRMRYRGAFQVVDTPDGVDPDECDIEVCKRYLDDT